MLEFAAGAPAAAPRPSSVTSPARSSSRERVLACAVRLLDLGMFRIGSEDYAEQNESYGLATLLKAHVTLNGTKIHFDYPGKSDQRREHWVIDAQVKPVVSALKKRRGGGPELLAYKAGRKWADVTSDDVNEYVKAGDRGRLLGQGLPDLERDRAGGGRRGRRAFRPRRPHEAAHQRCGQGRGGLPREHTGRVAARPTSTRACSTAFSPDGRLHCPAAAAKRCWRTSQLAGRWSGR